MRYRFVSLDAIKDSFQEPAFYSREQSNEVSLLSGTQLIVLRRHQSNIMMYSVLREQKKKKE